MKRAILNSMVILTLLFLLAPGSIFAAVANDLGLSDGHDLDQLWSLAQSNFDLEKEDSVLLLESQQIVFTTTGQLQTRIHRVVWVGTAVGIRGYADLRVPWNSATSSLDVDILRTWRDGKWWPDAKRISDTAVVHTLPHALEKASDYTTMRETMLLHDGVELGCIMETAYTITERNVPGRGGLFIFSQQDPAVLVEFLVSAPVGLDVQHEELNGSAAPLVQSENQSTTLTWTTEMSDALKVPHTSCPESYEATVAWSSWKDWQELGNTWSCFFNNAAQIDPKDIQDFLLTIYPTMGPVEKVTAVGEYLNKMVRGVHYNDHHWQFAPRSAEQTFATAYGHNLDRSVLAMALLRKTGLEVITEFIGENGCLSAPEIPRLQDMGHIMLRIPEAMLCGLNPGTGKVSGPDYSSGHSVFNPADNDGPLMVNYSGNGSFAVAISLEQDSDELWQGQGYISGSGKLSPISQIVASSDLRSDFVANLVESVIPGAEITHAIPFNITADLVYVNFDIEVPVSDNEAGTPLKLIVGTPAKGIASKIPHDVHLFESTRTTPVIGLDNLSQVVTVKIKIDDEQVIEQPESKTIQNKAGLFELDVNQKDGWLNLVRTLELTKAPTIEPANWSDLRILLLEEADPINGTIWLKQD